MKLLIISAIVLFATSAFAESGQTICQRACANSSITQCAKEIKGNDYDSKIIDVCNRIGTNSAIVDCARAAANNTYDPKIISVCNRVGTNSSIVQCVKDGGTSQTRQSACFQEEQEIFTLED